MYKKIIKISIHIAILVVLLTSFSTSYAQPVRLTDLPTPPSGVASDRLGGYIQTLFWIGISIAGVLAVLMVTIGGIQYMITESFGVKGDAKNRITMAIVGFVLAISSVLILQIINPELLRFNLNIKPTPTQNTSQPATGNTSTAGTGGCTTSGNGLGYVTCEWTNLSNTIGKSCIEVNLLDSPNYACAEARPDGSVGNSVYGCCGTISSEETTPNTDTQTTQNIPENGCVEELASFYNECSWKETSNCSSVGADWTNIENTACISPLPAGYNILQSRCCVQDK